MGLIAQPHYLIAKSNQTEEHKTKSGILVTSMKLEEKGYEVLSVGLGIRDIEAGNIVFCKPYGVISMTIDGNDYVFIHESDVLGVAR